MKGKSHASTVKANKHTHEKSKQNQQYNKPTETQQVV